MGLEPSGTVGRGGVLYECKWVNVFVRGTDSDALRELDAENG